MQRLAVLILTAGVAAPAAAADPVRPSGPVPAGYAPTAPQVPTPYPQRDRLGAGPVRAVSYEERAVEGPRPFFGLGNLFRRSAEPTDTYYPADGGRETYRVRQPLPTPPAEAEFAPHGATAYPPLGGCDTGRCGGGGGHDGRSCWARFTGWLCFRQTPVKLPLIPEQRNAPQYLYGTVRTGPGYGKAGCETHGSAPAAGVVTGRATGGPAGEVVMPGYRFANTDPACAPAGATTSSSYYRPMK